MINEMRVHILGLCLAVFTFFVGFLISPIRFVKDGVGSGMISGHEFPCSVAAFSSTHLQQVVHWSCSFENERLAADHFSVTTEKYAIISKSNTRFVVSFSANELTGYCVLRLDGSRRNDICSSSLKHILEFEKQRFQVTR